MLTVETVFNEICNRYSNIKAFTEICQSCGIAWLVYFQINFSISKMQNCKFLKRMYKAENMTFSNQWDLTEQPSMDSKFATHMWNVPIELSVQLQLYIGTTGIIVCNWYILVYIAVYNYCTCT